MAVTPLASGGLLSSACHEMLIFSHSCHDPSLWPRADVVRQLVSLWRLLLLPLSWTWKPCGCFVSSGDQLSARQLATPSFQSSRTMPYFQRDTPHGLHGSWPTAFAHRPVWLCLLCTSKTFFSQVMPGYKNYKCTYCPIRLVLLSFFWGVNDHCAQLRAYFHWRYRT